MTDASRRLRSPGLLASLLLLNLVVLPFTVLGLHSGDTDTFYHLAGGRWMAEHGGVLDREVFSFTIAGQAWTNYYWLFERAVYAAFEAGGGLGGVIAFRGAMLLAIANAAFALLWRRTGGRAPETLAGALLLVACVLPRALNVRPHLFSYLFLIVAIALLDRMRRRERGLEPWLPLLCVAWASLHGVEYPVVLTLAAVVAAEALWPFRRAQMGALLREPAARRWLALLALTAAAWLVNPFGWRLFATAGIATDREVMAQIQEMQPVPWRSLLDLAPALDIFSQLPVRIAALLGIALVPVWIARRAARPIALLGVGLGLYLARVRFGPELAILALPEVAATLAGLRAEAPGTPRARRLRAGALALAAGVVAASIASAHETIRRGALEPLDELMQPVGPCAFLERARVRGDLFSNPSDGGYVTWRLFPDVRIFMDMRTPEPFGARVLWLSDVVGDTIPLERLAARGAPVDVALFHRGTLLARKLREPGSGFQPVYLDDAWLLFLREPLEGPRAATPLRELALLEREPGPAGATATATPEHLEAARAEAERLVEVFPANHLAQGAALRILIEEKRFSEAAERAARLAARFPREPSYPFWEGLAHVSAGEEALALEPLREALARDPDYPAAPPALGEACLATGRAAEGLAVMDAYAARKDWRIAAVEYVLVAQLRLRAGRAREASDAYQRALWLTADDDPERTRIEHNLAAIEVESGDPTRALAYADAAIGHGDAFPQMRLIRARALRRLGRAADARAALDALLADPAAPEAIRADAAREKDALERP